MKSLTALPASLALGVSFVVAVFLVLTQKWHGRFSMDGLAGVQKHHDNPTPRIGGVAILAGVLAAYLVAERSEQKILGPLLMASLPAFLFGLAEDMTKRVSVMARLLATMLSGVLGWVMTGAALHTVGIAGDQLLLQYTVVSVLFTAFAIGGVANAVNIVDGFHGLASGYLMLAMLGLAAMALTVQDVPLAAVCLCIAAAVAGFFLVNWPGGKLFLGDGGSYFGGFALAWAAVLMLERHPEISPFALLLLALHPVTEVLFSIYRRQARKAHPGHPDRLHLHSLVMRRLVSPFVGKKYRNPATGVLIALMSVPAVVLSVLLSQRPMLAMLACIVLAGSFVWTYRQLVQFRLLRSLHLSPRGGA